MHIHKINTTSQEHQNFLAQNRKDPITGDSILEGDEVVFCASCKSVFLKDTWEYLGKQHCEQNETLIDFPIDSSIYFKAKDDTLLYYVSTSNKAPIYKPNIVKKAPWIKKVAKIIPYQNFFQSWLFIVLIVLGFVSSVLLTFLFQTPYIAIGGGIYTAILMFVPSIAVHFFGSKIPTFHKKLRTDSFYITNKSISFSKMYGMKEYILPVEYIDKLEFQENIGFYNHASFKIHYKKDGIMEVANCTLPSKIYENTEFFQALNVISSSASFIIMMKIEEKETLTCIRKVIDEENQKFIIEKI